LIGRELQPPPPPPPPPPVVAPVIGDEEFPVTVVVIRFLSFDFPDGLLVAMVGKIVFQISPDTCIIHMINLKDSHRVAKSFGRNNEPSERHQRFFAFWI